MARYLLEDRRFAERVGEDSMPGQLLCTGTAVLVQEREAETDLRDVAKRLVADAFEDCQRTELPVRYALLLASADWCEGRSTLSKDIRAALFDSLHYEVPLIGGSMAMLFCSGVEEGFIEHGVLLVLWCSEDLWVTVDSLERPYSPSGEPDEGALRRIAASLEDKAQIRLGWSAERYIFAIFPGFRTGEEGRWLHDSDLYFRLLTAFERKYQIVGASAANSLRPTLGYQFANDVCLESGLALAMVESDLATGVGMRRGYEPHETLRATVTRLLGNSDTGYEIEELDGVPASRRLQELRRELGLEERTPLVFGMHSGGDFKIHVPIDPPASGDHPVQLTRAVTKGGCLLAMLRKPQSGFGTLGEAIDSALKASHGEYKDVELILGFACTGLFRSRSESGVPGGNVRRWLQERYPDVPLVGGFCAGEFGTDLLHAPGPNNMSLWVRCWLDSYSSRARNRRLQRALMAGAQRLSACASPHEVMKTALEEALRAGAEGGQICLVDKELGLILGEGFGYATPRSKSGHDWKAVASKTYRKAPEIPGGDFPVEIREWSMRVGQAPTGFSTASVQDEDILTLITRTLHAVFVVDQGDPRFHCDQGLTSVCGFKTHLDIPLVGEGFKVVGTFQVSFSDGTILDRESLALWVSYSQKLASVLDRGQESEERQIRESILKIGDEILREGPDLGEGGRYRWCDRFLSEVTERLEADATHMRVLKGEELHLIGSAPDSRLCQLRRLTRPVTRPGEHGAMDRERLKPEGIFLNRPENLKEFHTVAAAIECAGEYGRELSEELARVRATAILPLFAGDELIGTWVIDSYQVYFFTERWRRILRAAGTLLGAMFRLKEAEYIRTIKQPREAELHSMKEELAGLAIEASKPDGDWEPLLDRLAEGFSGCRVTLYLVAGNEVTHGCTSPAGAVNGKAQPFQVSNYPAFRDLVASRPEDAQIVTALNREDPVLRTWPSSERTENLLAAPVFSPEGRLCGVLELVNRTRTDVYGICDEMERRAVWDIAQMLGAIISLRDYRKVYNALLSRFELATRIAAAGLIGANLVHELRRPFVNIQRAVDRLRIRPEEDPEPQYEKIVAQKDLAMAIIDQARSRGAPGARVEEICMIVRDAVRVVRPAMPPTGIGLYVKNELRAKVRVDFTSIMFALINVLNNALEAMGGKGTLTVTTEHATGGDKIIIRVHNTGPTLTPEELARMGLAGYTTKGAEHLGLGVPLARQAVETAGGMIEYSSPDNGGVEVAITLPIYAEKPNGDVARVAG